MDLKGPYVAVHYAVEDQEFQNAFFLNKEEASGDYDGAPKSWWWSSTVAQPKGYDPGPAY